MAADANIFQQYLRAPKSVIEYQAEFDERDAVRNRNALQSLALQQQSDQAQQGMAERNALRRIASGWTAQTTPAERIAALRGSGMSGLMSQADALETSDLARRKTDAEINDKTADTAGKKFKLAQEKRQADIQRLTGFQSPADAVADLQAAVSRGEVSAADAQAMMTRIPQDPGQFAQWQLAMLRGIMTPEQQFKATAPVLGTRDTGGAIENIATDPLTGKPMVTATTKKTQSPDNAATVGASLANAAATRDAAKLQADATRAAANTRRDQDTEMKLADDYRAQSKNFKEAKDAYSQLSATLDSATTSPAATLAAATKFMKVLDPGSVVRESELGMALNASGVIDRALNYISTLQSGKKLTAQQAADFKKTSQQIYEAAQSVQRDIDKDYQTKAKAYGLRPEMVTQDLGQNAKVTSWKDLK